MRLLRDLAARDVGVEALRDLSLSTQVIGAFLVALLGVSVLLGLVGIEPFTDLLRIPPQTLVLNALIYGLIWWTGRLLGKRRRLGGWLALVVVAIPVLAFVLGESPLRPDLLVASGIGAVTVLKSWGELTK